MTHTESLILRALALVLRAAYGHDAARKDATNMVAEIHNLLFPHTANAKRFYIKLLGKELYLGTHIDSGGMSSYWTNQQTADAWASHADAQEFMVGRLRVRYPDEDCTVVERPASP